MGFKLFDKLRLVVLVDVLNLLGCKLVIVFALDPAEDDLVGMREPDGLVVVF